MPSLLDPTDLLDQGQTLFSLLGSFWGDYYQGIGLIADVMRARAEGALQTRQDLLEMVQTVDRASIPVYHRVRWYPLVIRQSEVETVILTYADGDSLGVSADTTLSNRAYTYPLTGGVVDAAAVVTGLTTPEQMWVKGVDFTIGDGTISFRTDPFGADFAVTPEYEDNVIADRTAVVWLVAADIDRQQVATQFGYVLKLILESGERYKDLVNAVWDADLVGTTRDQLDRILAAACDAPLAQEDGEVVEQVLVETGRQLVITDKHVYVGGEEATALVAADDVLTGGDRLFDAFEVIDLSQGIPTADILAELTLPVEYLKGDYTGGLTFANEETALVVTTDDDRTRVEFDIDGDSDDVALFWDTIHANGTAVDATSLAQLLDQRPQPQSTDPDASSLPATINPLQFLVDNILRYGLTVVRLRPASFGPGALASGVLVRVLRTAYPPQGAVLTVEV